jgi:anhydro-N-acetylmuramic acid kinase
MADRLIIGAMSGTSADGVDVALVRFGNANPPALVAHDGLSYPTALREKILSLRSAGGGSFAELAFLAQAIAEIYADAVHQLLRKSHIAAADVTAIAAHGQTLFHAPPLTLQWIDPTLLASRCGIDVVSDFRRADCAVGGQGAPLVPFADALLFGHPSQRRIVLNLGGIANVTVLPGAGGAVTGSDTGPANCLSDALMADQGGYDAGGATALSGKANQAVVDRFTRDAYFAAPPPKSTDGPAMQAAFDRAASGVEWSQADAVATAAACCVMTVAHAIETHVGWLAGSFDCIVAGGGIRNAAVMDGLAQRGILCQSSDHFGVPAQAREAMAFAILGRATLDRQPANIPSVTGASRAVVLGAITPKP